MWICNVVGQQPGIFSCGAALNEPQQRRVDGTTAGGESQPEAIFRHNQRPIEQTMVRISALLCLALLIAAPAFADSCSRHKDASSDAKEQKTEVQS